MERPHILQFNLDELKDFFRLRFTEQGYRAKQLLDQIYRHKVLDPQQMANLPLPLREGLKNELGFDLPEVVASQKSSDGTQKYLLRLVDGVCVESVFIPETRRYTICFSTQAGCPVGCSFCATGQGGFRRNLTCPEILAQVYLLLQVNRIKSCNCVAMGQGEPFLNCEEVFKAIRILNAKETFNLSNRHLTLSTIGIPEGIRELALKRLPCRLAVSLHSAIQEVRTKLIPLSNKYPLSELKSSLKFYVLQTKNRITFEYLLLEGINDSLSAARALVKFAAGLPSFINLIPWNHVAGLGFEAPRPERVKKFASFLEAKGFPVAIRRERGSDINAACGQLTQTGLAV